MPPTPAPRGHRAVPFEIFFDLVFVFALTRILALMRPVTGPAMARALLLLVLLWLAWSSYAWLGNQVRLDVGGVRAGVLVAMAALFVAALVMPRAWTPAPGLDAPVLLALAYILLRSLHLGLYHWAAAEHPDLRRRIRLFATVSAVSWAPLLLGALLGGAAQAALWVAAFVVEIIGQRLSYALRGGWPLHSVTHFAERHGLVLIIALGESLAAAGVGAGAAVTEPRVLGAALLGLAVAICLWSLYFDLAAPAGARALGAATGGRRDRMAADAYSQAHLLLIVGVIYLACGVEEVLARVAEPYGGGHHGGRELSWSGAFALYGGVTLFLAGRLLFLWLSAGPVRPVQLVGAAVTVALLPVARLLPAAGALALLTLLVAATAGYERLARAR
ncbi:low temperature requirement protein A [Micromonospora mirobrigensis]|uniref:Low temperature requirement protein LtrA n=1 Tax=Micromonospora mirobrigensis TaxID=262898 RepID=A0A1C4YVV1_9ACTN|nr:low temperature requirement protein A [Micromonospora mirobrigensis]SCF24863.1 Low temperature requirement protein LtrA [Micromonospora mirobrigensis]